MGRILAIAHHTVREAMRAKIVLAFSCLIVLVLGALPLAIQRPDQSLSSMVQTFLTWSLMPVGGLLSFLAIFLGAQSISDEIYHRQVYMLMTKPLPAWQYIVGKWLGVTWVLSGLLAFSGASVYLVTRYGATMQAQDLLDQYRLESEVLTARGTAPLVVPDFTVEVERQFELMVEEGRFSRLSAVTERQVKSQIMNGLDQMWRIVPPGQRREFQFKNVMISDFSRNNVLQLRYKARGMGYAQDEILQSEWWFGDPSKATLVGPLPRRDVMDRYQVIPFPAVAVARDQTLKVVVENLDHLRWDRDQGAHIAFQAKEGFEVLYVIGSFGGNLLRTLFLIWCRLVLLAGVSVFAATFVSFPVACLISFCFYVLAISGEYVASALSFGVPGTGVYGGVQYLVKAVFDVIYWLWPKFSIYDGIETFVDGRNVSLVWDLQALGFLVCLWTTALLMTACIIFRRRQLAELSI